MIKLMTVKKGDRILEIGCGEGRLLQKLSDRGIIVTASSQGSGAAMDDSSAVVQVANNTAEKPVGLLLNDVVDLDLTRQHINYAKDEVQKGSKVDTRVDTRV